MIFTSLSPTLYPFPLSTLFSLTFFVRSTTVIPINAHHTTEKILKSKKNTRRSLNIKRQTVEVRQKCCNREKKEMSEHNSHERQNIFDTQSVIPAPNKKKRQSCNCKPPFSSLLSFWAFIEFFFCPCQNLRSEDFFSSRFLASVLPPLEKIFLCPLAEFALFLSLFSKKKRRKRKSRLLLEASGTVCVFRNPSEKKTAEPKKKDETGASLIRQKKNNRVLFLHAQNVPPVLAIFRVFFVRACFTWSSKKKKAALFCSSFLRIAHLSVRFCSCSVFLFVCVSAFWLFRDCFF
jgi:hypothetical protein